MTDPFDHLRQTFARPRTVLVKVLPAGFGTEDGLHTELTGRLAGVRLLRKRFEDGGLVCDSRDGIKARNGTLCDACRHPRCRPWLRIRLARDDAIYVLDLAVISARNLLALQQDAAAQDLRLEDRTLKLTVLDRGAWGEVRFERI